MLNFIGSLIGPITGLLDKFIEDKDQKKQLAHEIATMAEKAAHEAAMAQVAVNQQERQSTSLYSCLAGVKRGWICSLAMGYHFVFQPLIIFIAGMAGVPIPELPQFDMDSLMTVLLGMLGLGGLRTYEKQKGLIK